MSWSGLAADEAAWLDVYPAAGEPFRAPVTDNVFFLELPRASGATSSPRSVGLPA